MSDEKSEDNTASLSSATENLKVDEKETGDTVKSDKVKSKYICIR